MDDPDADFDDTETEVLDVVARERRVNPALVSRETGIDEAAARRTLDRLAAASVVRKVAPGLYDYDGDDPDEHRLRGIPDPNTETQTAPIDPTMVDEDDR